MSRLRSGELSLFAVVTLTIVLTAWPSSTWVAAVVAALWITVGIGHGCFDLIAVTPGRRFSAHARYLLLSLVVGGLFLLSPVIGVTAFVLFSGLHLGTAAVNSDALILRDRRLITTSAGFGIVLLAIGSSAGVALIALSCLWYLWKVPSRESLHYGLTYAVVVGCFLYLPIWSAFTIYFIGLHALPSMAQLPFKRIDLPYIWFYSVFTALLAVAYLGMSPHWVKFLYPLVIGVGLTHMFSETRLGRVALR